MNLFSSLFHSSPDVFSSAPGRINLIGEHTDYNNGYVLPVAVNLRTNFLASLRTDSEIHIWADNFGEKDIFSIHDIERSEKSRWADYVRGIFWVLKEEGFKLAGLNGIIRGNVPLESGLSSSAALEVSLIKGLATLFRLDLPEEKLARLGQKAENEFVGVRCGLMDQFIAVFGREDSALFLDCENLVFERVPLKLEKEDIRILVYDTKVPRTLAASGYNRRRAEAEAALEILQKRGVRSYKETSLEYLHDAQPELGPDLFKRAKHIVSENERVKSAVKALRNDDFRRVGELLFQSHESLRDDYEVSCPELDLLYETAREFPGCLGARLVGAGFGGSGIALLEKSRVKAFQAVALEEAAKRRFPAPGFHEISSGKGATAELLN